MLEKLLNRFGYTKEQPKHIYHKVYMHPISKERLDWLIARQIVLEPVINKIKMYIVHRPSSTGESQVLAAQTEAQSEYIRNQAEIEVLTDFLSKQQ